MNMTSNAPANIGQRESDHMLDAEQEQLGRLTGLMRRTEDLADRVVGAVPVAGQSGDASTKTEQRPGFIGALSDLYMTRDAVLERIAGALARIEAVL